MHRKKTVADLDVANKKVFVRVDFNVPLKEDGSIEDDTRIRAAIPTIQHIIDKGGIPVLASHLGRPKGKPDPQFRLIHVVGRLSELLRREVTMLNDCVGPGVKSLVHAGQPGEVFLLENLRFHEGEEKNDSQFALQLAELADLYVDDAFGAAHREHASVVGVAKLRPAAAGFLMEQEIASFQKVLHDAPRPFTVILGGAKVLDKIAVLANLISKCDVILIGGGMAYTFLKAQGFNVGKSKLEEDTIEVAKQILDEAKQRGVQLSLPSDHVIGDRFAADAQKKIVEGNIPDGWMGLDIGPRTAAEFSYWIEKSRSIVWNGPMGVFEMEPFSKGTAAVAKAIADFGGLSVVGGGDSVAAIEGLGLTKRFTHVSTGGGASLEMLEGKDLPGVAVIPDIEDKNAPAVVKSTTPFKAAPPPPPGAPAAVKMVEVAVAPPAPVVVAPPPQPPIPPPLTPKPVEIPVAPAPVAPVPPAPVVPAPVVIAPPPSPAPAPSVMPSAPSEPELVWHNLPGSAPAAPTVPATAKNVPLSSFATPAPPPPTAPAKAGGVRIAPSLLSCDFSRIAEEIKKVEEAGADWLHLDVMDGHFVPNLTIGPPVIKAIRKCTKLPLDVHLMITDPMRYAEAFVSAGADSCTFHVETVAEPKRAIEKFRSLKVRVGITLNPATAVSKIQRYLKDVDLVLIMSVNPGFGGQSFMPEMLSKVEIVRQWGFQGDLEIDGGINSETIALAAKSGANVFVAGHAIFSKPDYKSSIAQLRKLASEAK